MKKLKEEQEEKDKKTRQFIEQVVAEEKAKRRQFFEQAQDFSEPLERRLPVVNRKISN